MFSETLIWEIQNLWGSCFFSKYFKYNLYLKNAAKNWEKVFSCWYNCIWIGTVKFSLLRTGYFLSAANVWTSSPKIWHVNKIDFFQLNLHCNDQWIWWRCCDADFNSAWVRLPCCLWKGSLQQDFLEVYHTTFSESLTLEIQNL